MSPRPDIDPSRDGATPPQPDRQLPAATPPLAEDGVARTVEEHVQRLFEMTGDLLAVLSLEGRMQLLNPAWEQVLGWRPSEMVGRSIQELIHPEDSEQAMVLTLHGASRPEQAVNFTSRYRHRDGSWRWLLWSARCDGNSWFAAAKDVTDRMSLERQALHDPLTRLPNRLLLMDRARRALTRLHRTGGLVAVLFIDLDRFKAINDNLGHAVGDDLLISLSARLEATVRDSDTVARLGGDEFVILAEDLESDSEALGLAERVLAMLEEPIAVGSAVVTMRASVGVSICHEPSRDPEDLLREADVAMYRAKGTAGQRLGLFEADRRREMAARLDIESRLRHALARHEMRLVYQPAIMFGSGQPFGCEALLRWHPHDAPPMAPNDFLPLAEETNLIAGIGDWVLQSACMQAARWRSEGLPHLVSVNLSARSAATVEIAEHLREALTYSELPPDSLCIEVSEAAVLEDLERARATLSACKSVGVKIALDNYGAGRSSLSLPGMLPLDAIKIDRSLISGFERDAGKRAIVTAATAMARELRLTAVAVGIETERQLQLAREMGCSAGQGNLLAEPDAPERLRLDEQMRVRSLAPWRPIARRRRR